MVAGGCRTEVEAGEQERGPQGGCHKADSGALHVCGRCVWTRLDAGPGPKRAPLAT